MATAEKRMTTIRHAWIWNVAPERSQVKAGTPKWDAPPPTVPTPQTPPNPKPPRPTRPPKPPRPQPSRSRTPTETEPWKEPRPQQQPQQQPEWQQELRMPEKVGKSGFRGDMVAALLDCEHKVQVSAGWVRGRNDARGWRHYCSACLRVRVIKSLKAIEKGTRTVIG